MTLTLRSDVTTAAVTGFAVTVIAASRPQPRCHQCSTNMDRKEHVTDATWHSCGVSGDQVNAGARTPVRDVNNPTFNPAATPAEGKNH